VKEIKKKRKKMSEELKKISGRVKK